LNQKPREKDFTYGIVSDKTLTPLERTVLLYWFKIV
jgi:hypothetical protein